MGHPQQYPDYPDTQGQPNSGKSVKIELSQRLTAKRFSRLQIVTIAHYATLNQIPAQQRRIMSSGEKAATYRLHAAHCAEIAHRSSDPQARASLTKMSVAWLRLAELAETNRELQSPVATRATQLSE